MGVLADLKRWITGDWATSASSGSSDLDARGFGGGWQTVTGVGAHGFHFGRPGVKEAFSLPAVLQAVEILCGVFAMTPLIYYRRTPQGPIRAETSPLYALFHDRPNDIQSPFLFKEVAMGDMLLAGRFASFVHRDLRFAPAMLSRLNPHNVALSTSWDEERGTEAFYDASLPDGSRRRLTRAECWFVPGFSRDGLIGFDRIALMATALGGARATNEFAANFWSNNARPDFALEVPGKVEPAIKEQIRRDWMNLYAGPKNAGGVAVLDQAMKATMLGGVNKDAQFIEARQFGVLEVARAFGVPPHLLFELSRATFSNIEQQSLEFVIYSMGKHFERFASAATFYFAEPGHYFEFLPEALLKGDIKSRYDAYAIAIDKGIMNPNQVRRRENMPDREGGDDYRMGSGSMVEGQQQPAPPQPEREPAPDPTDD